MKDVLTKERHFMYVPSLHSSQVPLTSTCGFLIEIHLFHTLGSLWPFGQFDPSLAFLLLPSGFLNIFLIHVIILLIMNLPKSRQSLVSYHPFLRLLSFSLFFDLPQPTFKSSSYFRHLCQCSVLLRQSPLSLSSNSFSLSPSCPLPFSPS